MTDDRKRYQLFGLPLDAADRERDIRASTDPAPAKRQISDPVKKVRIRAHGLDVTVDHPVSFSEVDGIKIRSQYVFATTGGVPTAAPIIWRVTGTSQIWGSGTSEHDSLDEAVETCKRLLAQGYAVSVAAHTED